MKVLIVYYSKTGNTEAAAKAISAKLREHKHKVNLLKILPKKELKARDYKKTGNRVELKNNPVSFIDYDLVIVGTPVWNFSPSPVVLSYLRQTSKLKNKKFALFATCTAMSGSTILKMSNILSTRGAKVVESLTIKSIFALDKEKLKEAEVFAEKLSEKNSPRK